MVIAVIAGSAITIDVLVTGSPPVAAGSSSAPGTMMEFRYLAAQTSNFCTLDPQTIAGYPMSKRLQGACCNPLDMGTYQAQVRQLKPYSYLSVIPTDPYDVPVPLANTLIGYDRSIRLTPTQQSVYDDAMRMTPDKGPCCCHCWRWNADAGLAKYLLTTQRDFGARDVATIVALVNGCGGKHSAGLETG